jgi:hypothetical protein
LWGTSFVALSNKESFQVAINAFDQGGRGYPHSDTGQAAVLVASIRDPKLARLQGAPTFVFLDRGQAWDGSKSFDEAAVAALDKLDTLAIRVLPPPRAAARPARDAAAKFPLLGHIFGNDCGPRVKYAGADISPHDVNRRFAIKCC